MMSEMECSLDISHLSASAELCFVRGYTSLEALRHFTKYVDNSDNVTLSHSVSCIDRQRSSRDGMCYFKI